MSVPKQKPLYFNFDQSYVRSVTYRPRLGMYDARVFLRGPYHYPRCVAHIHAAKGRFDNVFDAVCFALTAMPRRRT